jgi:hypothetical protein
MAYFANIDENNIVTQVIFVDNNNAPDETSGIFYCNSIVPGNWIQTSYNKTIRKNYAGIGYKYDLSLDAFIPPKPFDSWVFDKTDCIWICPKERPTEGEWYWSEESLSWVQFS